MQITTDLYKYIIDNAKIRSVDRPYLVLDNSMARRELNWNPSINIQKGLKLMMQ